MIRRVYGLLGGGAALLTLASCATFDTENAATVNGRDISVEQLDAIREHIAENVAQFANATDIDDAGTVNGNLTRAVLQVLIRNEVAREVLAAGGGSVTDEQRAAARDALGGDQVPDGAATDALVDRAALTQALDELPAPDAATLQARYEEAPVSTGALCVDSVTTGDEASATAAAVSLRAGEVPPAADGVQIDAACVPVELFFVRLPADAQQQLIDARPGTVTTPIASTRTDGGTEWTVLRLQPWADAEAGLTQLYSGTTESGTVVASPGELQLTGALLSAQVTVSSTYGRWNPIDGGVVALTEAS